MKFSTKLCALLLKASQESGLSPEDTFIMAQLIAVLDGTDPLPPAEVIGVPFKFGERTPITATESLGLVPPPYAWVNVVFAWQAFEEDDDNIHAAMAKYKSLSAEALFAIKLNVLDWTRFWAIRHPKAKCRPLWAAMALIEEQDVAMLSDMAKAALKRKAMPQ